ncbi:MAG: VWA domain-containing protein [Betaproteobacteria bacterium]|nr:VWA domain-containing protein [Betaproteobacteria bacterium]
MGLNLEDFSELSSDLGPRATEMLRASWQEASRTFTPKGLEDWLRAAQALHDLGRGADPVASFIQEAPVVARELGEDAVAQLARSSLAMASRTSGAVIALVISTSPTAARRLGDPALFGAWLGFIDQLLAQAPRGVRPMLEHLDRLLGSLTLGGLRRWAFWGARAHRTDFAAQERYFALESPESLSILQQERKGTLFIDVQRRLGMYLRALWGRDFWLRPTSGDHESREGRRPFIEDFIIHVPDAMDDLAIPGGHASGLDLYRAMVAHAAAHLVYTREPLSAEGLTPLQMAAIGAVEDARVERLAAADFPGLAPLWRRLHAATPERGGRIGDLLDRVARALADPGYRDPHPVVDRLRRQWTEGALAAGGNGVSWDLGVGLAAELAPFRIAFHPREDLGSVAYRDDNRFLWQFDEANAFANAAPWMDRQVRRRVSLMEFVNATDIETAGDDAQEIWTLPTELFPYEDDGRSYNEREGRPPVADPVHYPEWDYQLGADRPDWVTVLERPAPAGDAATIDAVIAAHRPLVSRLRRLIEALRPQGAKRLRRQEEGDEIDLEAALRAVVDLRMNRAPDTRIHKRTVRHTRDLAVTLLLDLSQSTNETMRGGHTTVLALTREATALLADAMARLGDPFAIHGFASDGRHEVEYLRFKDAGEPWAAPAKARLAGMTGRLSTRMGAAIRHAGALLARQPHKRKLLIVLTDGAPSDVDVRDPQYLRADARKAVEALARDGVGTYCISLDPAADDYVSRIFGANRYAVVDRVEHLPERLPLLYLGLFR